MWTWIVKLVGGWLPIGTKPLGEYAGKIIWAVGIVIACIFVWHKITAPTSNMTTGDQTAKCIYNSYHQETLRPSFGCASLKVYEYYDRKRQEQQDIPGDSSTVIIPSTPEADK